MRGYVEVITIHNVTHSSREQNRNTIQRANEGMSKAKKASAAQREEIAELKVANESLTKQLEALQAATQQAAAEGAQVDPELAKELQVLKAERASFEKSLADERAAHLLASAQTTEHVAELVSCLNVDDGRKDSTLYLGSPSCGEGQSHQREGSVDRHGRC